VCVYSSNEEGKGARRRKRARDPDTSIGAFSSAAETSAAPSASQSSRENASKNPASPQRLSSSTAQEDNASNDGGADSAVNLSDALNTSIATFDDDFLISDEILRNILPEYACQSIDHYIDTFTCPSRADSDQNSYLSHESPRGGQAETHYSPCVFFHCHPF
jgi:hypothetical protein